MSVPTQIALGSLFLILCGVIHIAIAARLLVLLKARPPFRDLHGRSAPFRPTSAILAVFVASHTLQVCLWAAGNAETRKHVRGTGGGRLPSEAGPPA